MVWARPRLQYPNIEGPKLALLRSCIKRRRRPLNYDVIPGKNLLFMRYLLGKRRSQIIGATKLISARAGTRAITVLCSRSC